MGNMIVYIAGKVSGMENEARVLFKRAEIKILLIQPTLKPMSFFTHTLIKNILVLVCIYGKSYYLCGAWSRCD